MPARSGGGRYGRPGCRQSGQIGMGRQTNVFQTDSCEVQQPVVQQTVDQGVCTA